MSDGNGDSPIPPVPTVKAVIEIILHSDGTIAIKGPIQDKILFAGLLDVARERMFEHHRQAVTHAQKIMPIRRPLQ